MVVLAINQHHARVCLLLLKGLSQKTALEKEREKDFYYQKIVRRSGRGFGFYFDLEGEADIA